MKEKVYEVVSVYTKIPLYVFKNEKVAKEFIKKYLGGSLKYIVQEKEREEFTSLAEFNEVSQQKLNAMKEEVRNLKVVLNFDVKVRPCFNPEVLEKEDYNFVLKRVFDFKAFNNMQVKRIDVNKSHYNCIKLNNKTYFILNEHELNEFALAVNKAKGVYYDLSSRIKRLEYLVKANNSDCEDEKE